MKLTKKHIGWYCIIENLVNTINSRLIEDGHINKRGRKPVISRAYAVFYQVLRIELGFMTNFAFYQSMKL